MAAVIEETPVIKSGIGKKKSWSRQPSPEPAPKKLTLARAEKVAKGRPFELINGEIVYHMPRYYHAKIQARLCKFLGIYLDENPIGEVLAHLTHRLWPESQHQSRLPDISIVLNGHLPKGDEYPTASPDLAIEIISPDDGWDHLFTKADLYLEKGARVVWIVDPYRKHVMTVTDAGQRWVDDQLTCSEVLPDFSLDLSELFTGLEKPARTKE